MSKRGQVFILAAILMAVILFSLAAIRNKFEQKTIRGDFEALSENFQIEASKLVNSVIESPNIDVHEAFKSFSTMFTSYAKGKNPEYGLIYILSYGDKIQVANFLNRDINVQGCSAGSSGYYNVTIPGGFGNINANLDFEGFNIKADIPPAGLEFDCENISSSGLESECENINSLNGNINTPKNNNRYCAFLCLGTGVTQTELAVVIDGVPYKSCVIKGVPELMQVGILKQGEQAKVSATGKCISEDFCNGFNDQTSCEQTCGKGVCFWWNRFGGGGMCLNKYSYPDRASSICIDNGNEYCYGDQIWFYDTCGKLISSSGVDCSTLNPAQVCRDETNKIGLQTQCCVKKSSKQCEGDDVRWYSSPCDTKEDLETCGANKACRDVGGAQCCTIKSQTKCYENNIYWYNSCGTKEEPPTVCGENWVCKDQAVGLPEARCCINNYEKKCPPEKNDLYYYDSCGIKGDKTNECEKYCNTQTNKCCVRIQGRQACSKDSKKICNYVDDCGNKASCSIDCSAQDNKKCQCTDGVCECVASGGGT